MRKFNYYLLLVLFLLVMPFVVKADCGLASLNAYLNDGKVIYEIGVFGRNDLDGTITYDNSILTFSEFVCVPSIDCPFGDYKDPISVVSNDKGKLVLHYDGSNSYCKAIKAYFSASMFTETKLNFSAKEGGAYCSTTYTESVVKNTLVGSPSECNCPTAGDESINNDSIDVEKEVANGTDNKEAVKEEKGIDYLTIGLIASNVILALLVIILVVKKNKD